MKKKNMDWLVIGLIFAIGGMIAYIVDDGSATLASPKPSSEGTVERLEIGSDGSPVTSKKPTRVRLNIEPSFN